MLYLINILVRFLFCIFIVRGQKAPREGLFNLALFGAEAPLCVCLDFLLLILRPQRNGCVRMHASGLHTAQRDLDLFLFFFQTILDLLLFFVPFVFDLLQALRFIGDYCAAQGFDHGFI